MCIHLCVPHTLLSESSVYDVWFVPQHAIGGRVTVVQACMPTIGPGALKNRDVNPPATKKVRCMLCVQYFTIHVRVSHTQH